MTLTQLSYIVAVDTCRHFGRASEQCHVSQPTLSADGRTAVAMVRPGEFQLWDLSDPDAPRQTATMTGWPLPHGVDAAGTLIRPGIRIPVEANGEWWLHFSRWTERPAISAADILHGLRGR